MTPEQVMILICLNAALSLFWYIRGHNAGRDAAAFEALTATTTQHKEPHQ